MTLEEFLPDLTAIEDKEIAPSLAGFSFSKDGFSFDDSMFLPNNSHRNLDLEDDEDDDGGNGNMGDGDLPPIEDFFTGADAVNDDFGDPFGGDDDNHSNAGSVIGEAHAGGQEGRPGPFVSFDPRRMPNDRDLVLAMADGDGGTLDYFDQNALKNWAGPEHWKLRKVIRRRRFSLLCNPS
jgi:condensin complex subunit 2